MTLIRFGHASELASELEWSKCGDLMPNILMCYKHNTVGKSSFLPLWGTLFDPIWVQMYLKSPKAPKLWYFMLLETFWYPIHTSHWKFWCAACTIELENRHFFPLRYAFWPNMGPNVPEITQNPKIMNPYVIRVILVPHTWSYVWHVA